MTRDAQSTEATARTEDGSASGSGSASRSRALVAATSEPGARIGRYVVVSRLGAGAMGVVLAAYDPELDRKVALKLLRAGPTSGQAARQRRLVREAKALAKLSHPNVVGVHDVGIHQDRVFIAMEYVAGRTLRAWLHDAQPTAAEILAVFVAAGRGLEAAHAAGLVHRDFKPDNVMIGDEGRVRVVDFGVVAGDTASEVSERDAPDDERAQSGLTRTGALLGTPAYMAPEQFRGQPVDGRTDQFAFCVALFEALYGRRPFPGEGVTELMTAVLEGRREPAPAGVRVPGNVAAALERGLRLEPGRRWSSMGALLDAIEPRPRRRGRWASIGVGLLGLGLGALAWMRPSEAPAPCEDMRRHLRGVWDATRRDEVRTAILATGLGYAETTAAHVVAASDRFAAAWVEGRTEACEATRTRGEQSEELLDLKMGCYDERLRGFASALDVLAAADATVVRRAGDAIESPQILAACADADALRRDAAAAADPAEAEVVEDIRARRQRAYVLYRLGKVVEGHELLRDLAAEAAKLGDEPLQAEVGQTLALVTLAAGDAAEARRIGEDAFYLAVANRRWTIATMIASDLVFIIGSPGYDYEEGRHWYALAEALDGRGGKGGDGDRRLANLGAAAITAGKYDEAKRILTRVAERRRERHGDESIELATTLTNLGQVAERLGEHEAAQAHLQQSIRIQERALGSDHPDLAKPLDTLARAMLAAHRPSEARASAERALALRRGALGPGHVDIAASLVTLTQVNQALGDLPRARAFAVEALEIFTAALGPDHPEIARQYGRLGLVDERLGDCESALPEFERAIAGLDEERDRLELATALTNAGRCDLVTGRAERSLERSLRAHALRDGVLAPDHRHQAWSLTGIGRAHLALGHPQEAIEPLTEALRIRRAPGTEPSLFVRTALALAKARWDSAAVDQDRDAARALAEEAAAVLSGAIGVPAPERAAAEAWLTAQGIEPHP